MVQRIDRSPRGPAEDRLYWYPACGYLNGVQLAASPIPHEIAAPHKIITKADLQLRRIGRRHTYAGLAKPPPEREGRPR